MSVRYREEKLIAPEQLERLFSAVKWVSGKYPVRLSRALTGYGYVLTAREGDRLVGLIAAMDDGEMTAYVHYLLIDPAFQRRGIGKELMARLRAHYAGYLKIVLHAEGDDAVAFYRFCGLQEMDGCKCMGIDLMV